MSTVEIHTFRLKAGADEKAFLRADARVQTEFAPFQPGFIRRTTARGADGDWLVLVLWGDSVLAEQAIAASSTHPAVTELSGFVEASSHRLQRFETLD